MANVQRTLTSTLRHHDSGGFFALSLRCRGLLMIAFVSVFSFVPSFTNQGNHSLSMDKALVEDPLTPYQQNHATMINEDLSTTPSFHSIWTYPLKTRNSSLIGSSPETRAIALLSMGPGAAESTLVERCIISIRKRGKFLGPIMVVTDAPLERYESLTKEDYYVIVLHPERDHWHWDLRRDMPYKRFKTYLLEYLRRDDRLMPVQLVYYLDIDVVVGQPLLPWFQYVETTYMNYPANQTQHHPASCSGVMALFDGNISPLQGGQFVVQRGRSEPCLNRWRYHIDANPTEHKDQPSLTLMWNEQHGSQGISSSSSSLTNCTLLRMPQAPYLEFLSAKEMSRFQGDTNGLFQTYPTLMHIKNTQHANTIPDALQKRFFQNLLELSPEMVVNITSRRRIRPNRTWSALQVKGAT